MCLRNQIKVAYLDLMRRAASVPGSEGQKEPHDSHRGFLSCLVLKRRLNEIYVRHTGQDYATIEKTLDRDYFLSAEDARTFGIVDKVITKRDPLDEKIQQLMPVS